LLLGNWVLDRRTKAGKGWRRPIVAVTILISMTLVSMALVSMTLVSMALGANPLAARLGLLQEAATGARQSAQPNASQEDQDAKQDAGQKADQNQNADQDTDQDADGKADQDGEPAEEQDENPKPEAAPPEMAPGDQGAKPKPADAVERPLPPTLTEKQKQLIEDTDRLYALATDLKSEVDKTNKDTLSIQVILKADEIEKLARSIRDRNKPEEHTKVTDTRAY
jgi:hypothetical protein